MRAMEFELRKKEASFLELIKIQLSISFKTEFAFKINLLLTLVYFFTEFIIIIGIGLFIDHVSGSDLRETTKFLILGVLLKDGYNIVISTFYEAIRNGYWSSQVDFFNLFPNGRLAYLLGYVIEKIIFHLFKLFLMVVLSFLLGIFPRIENLHLCILSLLFFIPTLVGLGLISFSSFNLLNARMMSPVVGIFAFFATVFSNTIVSESTIISILGSLSSLFFITNPFYHISVVIRLLSAGTTEVHLLWPHYIIIIVFNVGFMLLGMVSYKISVKDADVNGSLSRWN